MASQVMSWLIAVPLLGVATGARSMTPIAVVCWFAWLGLLRLEHTWAFWCGSIISVVVFTVLALGEFVGDKLPKTPSRISPVPLAARLVFGAMVGAIIATDLHGSLSEGIILGTIGALIGSFGGYHLRRYLTQQKHCRDWPVAVLEDFCVVLITVFALRLATT